MDHHEARLRMLVDNVSYVQRHLVLTSAFLEDAVNKQVLTVPEKHQIETCPVSGAGALGVVLALCRKDARCLRSFNDLLDAHSMSGIAKWLARVTLEPRDQGIKKTRSNSIHGASANSAHLQAYNISETLTSEANSTNISGPLSRRSSTHSVSNGKNKSSKTSYVQNSATLDGKLPDIPPQGLTSGSISRFSNEGNNDDVASYPRSYRGEKGSVLDSIDKAKCERLKRLEGLNRRLVQEVEEANFSLERANEKNNALMMTIMQMKDRDVVGYRGGEEEDSQGRLSIMHEEKKSLKCDLKLKDLEIMDLEKELDDYDCKMNEKEELINALSKELRESRDREKELRKALGVNDKADNKDIISKIKEMKETSNSIDKVKIQKLQAEISKCRDMERKVKDQEKQLDDLKHDKNCLTQRLRNRRLVRTEMNYTMQSVGLISTRSMITSSAKGTDIKLTKALSLSLTAEIQPHLKEGQLYCVLCHNSFEMAKKRHCYVHYQGCESSRWQCCRQDGSGCLSLQQHFCIIVQKNGTCLLTDGNQSLELKATFLR